MFILWHDSDYDFAFWVYKNSSLSKIKEKTILREMPQDNSPKELLKSLRNYNDFFILPVIKFEHPDIILQHIDEKINESKILFVSEFMTHTPQWHHPAQRFSRIYGASQLGIPVSLVLPNCKVKIERKSGKYKETKYKCSPVIYSVFKKTTLINKNPTLMFHWSDVDGYLEIDAKHPTAPVKKGEIDDWFLFLDLAIKSDTTSLDKFIKEQIKKLESKEKVVKLANYETVRIFPTEKVITLYKLDKDSLSETFLSNKNTLIFKPTGLVSSSYFRTDPYAGMLCVYDNLFCRDDNGKRIINLILRAKDVKLSKLMSSGTFVDTKEHDEVKCPFKNFNILKGMKEEEIITHLKSGNCPYTSSKQQRIYDTVSDIIIFDKE